MIRGLQRLRQDIILSRTGSLGSLHQHMAAILRIARPRTGLQRRTQVNRSTADSLSTPNRMRIRLSLITVGSRLHPADPIRTLLPHSHRFQVGLRRQGRVMGCRANMSDSCKRCLAASNNFTTSFLYCQQATVL